MNETPNYKDLSNQYKSGDKVDIMAEAMSRRITQLEIKLDLLIQYVDDMVPYNGNNEIDSDDLITFELFKNLRQIKREK